MPIHNSNKTGKNNDTTITHLLTLPNELFPYLLNYLSASEILKAFLEISEHNARLACIVLPYLSYINLSHESNFWLSTRLSKFNKVIYSLSVTTRQLPYLCNLPSLQKLTIVEIHSTPDLRIALHYLKTGFDKLCSIKLNFIQNHDIYNLTSSLDIPLKEFDLSLRCSFTPVESMSLSLRHLTLRVDSIKDLFQLGKQLPMLESLSVNVNGLSGRNIHSIKNFDSFVVCSQHLKRLDLYSREIVPNKFERKYRYDFEYFEKFIHGCSSSLEYLALDIVLPNQSESFCTEKLVDGDRLEQNIIGVLPHLKKFEFRFEFELPSNLILKYERSFANESWRQRCLVISYPVTATLPINGIITMIVFSVNDTSTLFEKLPIVSSQITNWHTNIYSTSVYHTPNIITTMRSLTISPIVQDTILTLDLFRWIATSFPRLRNLELVRTSIIWQLEDESVSYPTLNSVRALHLRGKFSTELIRRLLVMCSRLRYLKASQSLLRLIITDPELCNDPYLTNIYNQILEIQLFGSTDYVSFQGRLRDVFPYAYFF